MRLLRLWSFLVVGSLATLGVMASQAAAAAPAVTLTPTSLTFAAQAIGTISAAQSVTVVNSADAPLFISSTATDVAPLSRSWSAAPSRSNSSGR
jgi:hypothetical protein